MNVGAAIKELLAERGLKPADMARGTGFSTPYISQLTTGKQRDISLRKALIIADYFDISIDDFINYALKFGD